MRDTEWKTSQPGRPTIGFLTHSLTDEYGVMLWRGALDAAQDHDVNLICFVSNDHPTPDGGFAAHARTLYEIVNVEHIQGLVISGGPMSHVMGQKGLKALCEKYHPLPMSMIGVDLPDIPHVIVDNRPGMRDLIRHFLETHAYRRIAFIKGPDENPDAIERYQVYTSLLAEYGLPLDPQLIAPGNFTREAGRAAMHLLLHERRVQFDAVIAVNDPSALGAMEVLHQQGLLVPKDIAVGGFDNIEETKAVTPSLTTVQQPTHALGYHATEFVLRLLDGDEVPRSMVLGSELVVRRSCGCQSYKPLQVISAPIPVSKSELKEILCARQPDLVTEMVRIGGNSQKAREWSVCLFDTFVNDISGIAPGQFLQTLDDILQQIVITGERLTDWQNVIQMIWEQTQPYLGGGEMLLRATTIWQQARIVFGEAFLRMETSQAFQTALYAQNMREFQGRLFTSFDMPQLMNTMAHGLPQLHIPACYLTLYDAPESPLEDVHVVLAYDDRGRLDLPPTGQPFPSVHRMMQTLLPQHRRSSMVLVPIYLSTDQRFYGDKEYQLGFVIFEVGPRDLLTYDTLRVEISSALRVKLLLEEIQTHRDHLEELVKERSAELAAEQSLLRTLIDNIPDLIYVKDLESRFLLANPAILKIMNVLSTEALLGKTDFDFYPEALARKYYDDEQHILASGEALINAEEPVIDQKTREPGWLLTTKTPLYNEYGDIIGLVGIGRNITKLKQAQEQLLELEKAIETMSLGVTITDLKGKIIYINPAEAHIHGYQVEELLGQDVRIFAPPEFRQSVSLDRIMNWKGLRRESVNVRKDGRRFPVWLMSEIVRNPDGMPIAIVTSCEDITERKKAEEELKRHRDHLEELVKERTAELRETNEQLQELNASKDKFFSIISHDLRSPFNVILGFSQLIDEHVDRYSRAEIKYKIGKLRSCAEQLYALLENLLTWSRIQRGVIEHRPEYINLYEIANDTIELFTSKAEHKQILLKNAVRQDSIVYADYNMVNTVFRNLISNAVKFTHAGGFIEVSTTPCNEHTLEIAVADTGIGISRKDLLKLFRIDVQYTNAGTDGEQGTGLGLNLCKELIEKNGGIIWVDSEIGKGTTFRFTLLTGG